MAFIIQIVACAGRSSHAPADRRMRWRFEDRRRQPDLGLLDVHGGGVANAVPRIREIN
jgi:hypothetical protein